ncbi:MAG: hypothetical protein Q9208_007992 [Pyrenodesmia sp. 3 TL-2023]
MENVQGPSDFELSKSQIKANLHQKRAERTSGTSHGIMVAAGTKRGKTASRVPRGSVGEMERRLSAFGEQVKILTGDKKKFEDDISSYKARLVTTRKEATEARSLIQRLSEQNSKYRGIILKGSNDNIDFPDDEIHIEFIEIRDLIQRIEHRYYAVQGDRKLSGYNNPWIEEQKRFQDILKGLA